MIKNKISFRVRYQETDQMGVVYHGNYAQYLEIGRIEWLRTMGISYKKMEAEGVMLPVVSLNLKFIRSALFDDVLTIETTLKKEPLARIEFEYTIHNQEGLLLVKASTVLAFMNSTTKKPMRCPATILERIRA